MIDPVTLAAFVPIALALNLTPGPDMAFCVAQGMGRGARAGWAASAGVALGCMVHVTVAGMGLGAFLAAHPAAFDAIRWAGVAYLLGLALLAVLLVLTVIDGLERRFDAAVAGYLCGLVLAVAAVGVGVDMAVHEANTELRAVHVVLNLL